MKENIIAKIFRAIDERTNIEFTMESSGFSVISTKIPDGVDLDENNVIIYFGGDVCVIDADKIEVNEAGEYIMVKDGVKVIIVFYT